MCLGVHILPLSNSTWINSALVSSIQCKFYFHSAHLRKEGRRYLEPALNAKRDHVPGNVLGKVRLQGTVTSGDELVRPSFVLVCGRCLWRKRLGTTGEGSRLVGGSRPAIPRTSYQGEDGRDSQLRTRGGRPKIQELEALDGGILRRVLGRGFGSLTLGAYGLSSTCTAICVDVITSSNGSTQPKRLKNILTFARATLHQLRRL